MSEHQAPPTRQPGERRTITLRLSGRYDWFEEFLRGAAELSDDFTAGLFRTLADQVAAAETEPDDDRDYDAMEARFTELRDVTERMLAAAGLAPMSDQPTEISRETAWGLRVISIAAHRRSTERLREIKALLDQADLSDAELRARVRSAAGEWPEEAEARDAADAGRMPDAWNRCARCTSDTCPGRDDLLRCTATVDYLSAENEARKLLHAQYVAPTPAVPAWVVPLIEWAHTPEAVIAPLHFDGLGLPPRMQRLLEAAETQRQTWERDADRFLRGLAPDPPAPGHVDSLDPEDGHRFRFTVQHAGSHCTADGPASDSGLWSLPLTVEVRGWSLAEAVETLVDVTFAEWHASLESEVVTSEEWLASQGLGADAQVITLADKVRVRREDLEDQPSLRSQIADELTRPTPSDFDAWVAHYGYAVEPPPDVETREVTFQGHDGKGVRTTCVIPAAGPETAEHHTEVAVVGGTLSVDRPVTAEQMRSLIDQWGQVRAEVYLPSREQLADPIDRRPLWRRILRRII